MPVCSSQVRGEQLLIMTNLHLDLRTLNVNYCLFDQDAFMLAVDRKGFDVLAKVPSSRSKDGTSEYVWKQFRFPFKEEALDVETFCQQLVKMEEEAVKKVSGYSGLT